MKSLKDWFAEYSVSHQNPTNKKIHFICVPAIFFSVIGLLMSIPTIWLEKLLHMEQFLFINWAVVVLIPVLIFYLRLSLRMAFYILIFSILCLIGNFYLAKFGPLWISSLIIFALAWVGQFYGHQIEGKKPSFFKDLQFLLIGPAWILNHLLKSKK